jgi:FMN phosphatase YigB (HAD superfamily)
MTQPIARMPAIKAVLFDVDGTLYMQPPLRVAMACEMAFSYCAALRRKDRSFARIIARFRRTRERLRDEHESDATIERAQYSAVARRLGCTDEEVAAAVQEWIYRRPLKWLKYCRRPGLVECLEACSARGLRLGVFSDYPANDKLAALGIGEWFEFVLSATDADINAFKPKPHGFLAAARRWGLTPAEVLYVGDRADVDAAGATSAGMPCLLIGTRATFSDRMVRSVSGFEEIQRVIASDCYA